MRVKTCESDSPSTFMAEDLEDCIDPNRQDAGILRTWALHMLDPPQGRKSDPKNNTYFENLYSSSVPQMRFTYETPLLNIWEVMEGNRNGSVLGTKRELEPCLLSLSGAKVYVFDPKLMKPLWQCSHVDSTHAAKQWNNFL